MVFKNPNEKTPLEKFNELIIYLKDCLGNELQDRLGVTRNEWRRLYLGKSLPFDRFEQIISHLGINSLNLVYQKVDHYVCLQYLMGHRDLAPMEYQIGAFSSRRIGSVLLKILNENIGPGFCQQLCLSLQIGSQFFTPDTECEFVSTELYGALYAMLVKGFGFSEEDLFWLGQQTAFENKESAFAKKFNNFSILDSYSCFLEEVANNVEQSYNYEMIKLTSEKAIVKKTLSHKLQDTLKKKSYGNKYTCIYSLGFGSTVGYFSRNEKFPNSTLTKNLYSGEDYTLFEWKIDDPKQPRLFL
ncbi:MAG: hypothetical protein COW00_13000 [Bdellovibrio sp. CG12_big_fil_rev_8_21_14_0_65_39_13]|nr:MAG: hypothetical protein COW78_05320 [Bdellovibrio sp. CG22_combo_CG10-13_8_21_14_all_39_27]PIQ58998.1 MAG: hypothetical protein COW00_13000 [Bdellovibrio sp. CG12_big_fil_rev_8_21_14_0_65_39_13]PIR33965.1 MAG: hypothetical protein COV37_14715 [Bdellovibrio sp. CG11_big_fil_rev_8_21_14_0_20_39_38]